MSFCVRILATDRQTKKQMNNSYTRKAAFAIASGGLITLANHNHLGQWYSYTGKRVTVFRKFWARSDKWGKMGGGGSDESRATWFFCPPNQTTFRQLPNGRLSPNLATTRESMPPRKVSEEIFTFLFTGHLPQKTQKWTESDTLLMQTSLQFRGCTLERYRSFHIVAHQLFCLTYGFEATGRQTSARNPAFYKI